MGFLIGPAAKLKRLLEVLRSKNSVNNLKVDEVNQRQVLQECSVEENDNKSMDNHCATASACVLEKVYLFVNFICV
jgi:hypothetical protein